MEKQASERKLTLSGWLKNNYPAAYYDVLKHQRFLFFYESLSKSLNKECEFKGLKGYKNGPVFSDILGYRHNRRKSFDISSEQAYLDNNKIINKDVALIAGFLVSTLSKEELSELTHAFNIWASQADRIRSGEKNVKLSEEDFSEDDRKLSDELFSMYSVKTIEASEIIECNNKYFVFSKTDYKNLTGSHYDVLGKISEQKELENPVFAELDKDGRICID